MRFSYTVSMLAMLAFATPALAAEDYVMMKVNNQDVAASEVKRFWEGLFPAGQAPAFETVKPEVRDQVLRGVMAERVVLAEAISKGADKSESVQKQIEEMRQKLIVRAFLDARTGDSISEADLKKEYDAVVAANKDEREVHARHILVQSEAEAKDVRKKLDEGKAFEAVAREYSKDAASAKNGGDLGYFTRDAMVKEFADAAYGMKKGEISAPVKTGFGWHIIKVEDSRKLPAPAFADVKDQLRTRLQEKRLNDYVSGLVKSADVKVYDAKGKEQAFNKSMPSSAEKPAPAVKSEAPKKVEKPVEKKAEKPAEPVKSATPAKPAEKKAEQPAEAAKPEKAEKADKPDSAAAGDE